MRSRTAPVANGSRSTKLKGSDSQGGTGRRSSGVARTVPTGSTGGSTFRIVWHCHAAQHIWSQVRSWWQHFGLWHDRAASTSEQFLLAVFSLRLPATPPKIWELASLHQSRPKESDSAVDPFPALQAVWQQIVLETLVFRLSWRSRRDDHERPWAFGQAAVLHDAFCQRVLHTLALRLAVGSRSPELFAALISEFRVAIQRPFVLSLPSPAPGSTTHVLFFDGGSRGNPGPGGSGAVLVEVSATIGSASIIWSAAMSYASSRTTNNQAEYHGLLVGLRAATSLRLRSLEVIGDSALILRQLREHKPPRNRALLALYSRGRPLADALGIQKWTHHLRANNKMADAMANVAVDTRKSAQVHHPTSRKDHSGLSNLLANDLRPWWPLSGHHVEV